jgi:hypothetical protein
LRNVLSLGNGTKHTREDLPFVLAGRAGGRLKTGGAHLRPDRAVPIGRLLLSVLRLVGVEEPGFAGETAPMPELVG